MSKKALRIAAITEHLENELSHEEIVEIIADEFRVKEDTILKDINSLVNGDSGEEKKFVVPKGEENTVIAEVERRERDPDTGEKTSKPQIYKADIRMWAMFLRNRASQGLKINKILNLPEGAEGIEPDPDKGWSLTKAEKAAKAKAEKASK